MFFINIFKHSKHIASLFLSVLVREERPREEGQEQGSSEGRRASQSVIWDPKISPRVKLFRWRACHGSLARMKNLHWRLNVLDAYHNRCGAVRESDFHLECIYACQMWDETRFELKFLRRFVCGVLMVGVEWISKLGAEKKCCEKMGGAKE